jgi:hypothetical protein
MKSATLGVIGASNVTTNNIRHSGSRQRYHFIVVFHAHVSYSRRTYMLADEAGIARGEVAYGG